MTGSGTAFAGKIFGGSDCLLLLDVLSKDTDLVVFVDSVLLDVFPFDPETTSRFFGAAL